MIRAAATLAAAAALLLGLPAGALAHAVLTHTTPHQGASVERAPAEVVLEFNEPVEASFGAVRVFDSNGERVDRGEVSHPGGEQGSAAIALEDGLGRGVYTATYRVVSADGHPVSGGFSFGVGEAVGTGRDTPEVAELLERTGAGAAVEGGYGAVRAVHYLALLLVLGAIVFRLLLWPQRAERAWPAGLLVAVALAGFMSALLGIVFQGALAGGVGLSGAFDSQVIDGALGTRTGEAWLLRACAWFVVLGFALLFRSAPRRRELAGLVLPAAVLVGSLPYGGHAGTQSPRALLVPADVLHVLAAGAWLGGLILLLAVFWPRGSSAVAAGAAGATARFSRLALPAIVVLVAAGVVQAWFYLDSPGSLVSSTYGLALVAKVGVLAGVIALAAGNRRRVAQLAGRAPNGTVGALRRAMLTEVMLAALVLAATATLVRAAPPAAVAEGPVVRELDLGPMRVQLDIEPARAGPNDYHVYLFDRRTGAQVSRVDEVTLRMTQPEKEIGPIRLAIPRKGPAHYELLGPPLGVKGTWEAELSLRVSEFDQYTARTEFDVR
jgi:copper transport protein